MSRNGVLSSCLHYLYRVTAALLLLFTLLSLGGVQSVHATTRHSPPWSDNLHYTYPRDYTVDAASPATSRQASVGYSATTWHNKNAADAASLMQNDAVWSMYAHASSFAMQAYDGSAYSDLTRDMVRSYNLSGMKVAVFYGCNTASGSDHITKAAADAGVGASIGFYDLVFISGGTTTGPAYTWSKYFWESMAGGNSINTAAIYARDRFYQERGDYGNVDKFSTWGNGGQTITPAGYK